MSFYPEGIKITSGKHDEGTKLAWQTVIRMEASTSQEIEARVTATRILLFGALAWVAKKQKTIAFLEVEDDEGEWIFAVPEITATELRAGLAPIAGKFITRAPARSETHHSSNFDIRARLSQLEQLRGDGLISDAEYSAKRYEILCSL